MLFLKPNTIECFDLACFFETGPGWMLRGEGLLEIGEVVFSRSGRETFLGRGEGLF